MIVKSGWVGPCVGWKRVGFGLGHVFNIKYIQKYTDEPDSHLVVVFGSDTCGGNGVLKTLFELRIIWAGVDSILK